MIYFTSGIHFGHQNMIRVINGLFTDVEDMNESFIRNINDTCSKRDILVILGDVAYRYPVKKQMNTFSG